MNACGIHVHVEVCEIVNCIDEDLADLNDLGLAQARSPRPVVVAASHCGKWCDDRERLENAEIAYITAVNDVVAALEERECLGTQETMCVRDEAYAKQSKAFATVPGRSRSVMMSSLLESSMLPEYADTDA